jgi:hypothetical protein
MRGDLPRGAILFSPQGPPRLDETALRLGARPATACHVHPSNIVPGTSRRRDDTERVVCLATMKRREYAMKKSAVMSALFAIVAAPAFAGSSDYLTLDEIVDATGMEKREVLLMVGAKSNNHYYLTSDVRVSREWKQAVKAAGLIVEQQRDASGRVVEVRVRRVDANA